MGLGLYVLRRLLMVIPTLFGVTLISFFLTYLLPGNPALVKAGPLATPAYLAEIERQMGLDQPVWVQYGRYVGGLFRGDLGESSATGRPVLQDFLQRLPADRQLADAVVEPRAARAAGIHAGLQRHGAACPHGARDHAGDSAVGLHHGRLGRRPAAAARHLWRRPAQRPDSRRHDNRRR